MAAQQKQNNGQQWSVPVFHAIEALEKAESGLILQDAPWWDALIAVFEQTRQAGEVLSFSVLNFLTEKLLQSLVSLRSGMIDLGPSTLRVYAAALRQWQQLRAGLETLAPDAETQAVLRTLGVEMPTAKVEESTAPTLLVADVLKYLPLFVEETEEGLETMQSRLIELEAGFQKAGYLPEEAAINELFRHAHKIKASAAAMGFTSLGEITHTMETVLDQIRSGQLRVTNELISTLLAALDQVRQEVETAKQGLVPSADLSEIKAALMWYLGAAPVPLEMMVAPLPVSDPVVAVAMDNGEASFRFSLRIKPESPMPEMRIFYLLHRLKALGTFSSPSSPLDEVENQSGLDFISGIFSTAEALESVQAAFQDDEVEFLKIERIGSVELLDESPVSAFNASVVSPTIRVPIPRLDDLMNLSGELSISRNSFLAVSRRMRGMISTDRSHVLECERVTMAMDESIQQLSQLAVGIQQIVLEMRMVPLSPLFERCRRIVRDLGEELRKEVDLVLKGANTSLDKKIIDQLSDPLNHMIRNAVDHGLESPEERKRLGKPVRGTISLGASREGGKICIDIRDDGRGIPVEDIRKKIVEQGLVKEVDAAKLSPEELFPFIFHPGFSTAREVTNISGRGVGMDIAHKRIEEISGSIVVRSEPGRGTHFKIYLPLTVVSQVCLLFDIHSVTFAVALHSISEILKVRASELLDMKFGKFIRLRNELIPVFRIRHFFKNTAFNIPAVEPEKLNLVLIKTSSQRVAIVVDDIRGEEEILVKNPGELVGEITGLAGVSVLTSGDVALILDVEELVEQSLANVPPDAENTQAL